MGVKHGVLRHSTMDWPLCSSVDSIGSSSSSNACQVTAAVVATTCQACTYLPTGPLHVGPACLSAADIQVPEVRAFYGFQIAMENIHSEMYSLLLETYVQDAAERRKLLSAINNIPVIQKKAAWAMK